MTAVHTSCLPTPRALTLTLRSNDLTFVLSCARVMTSITAARLADSSSLRRVRHATHTTVTRAPGSVVEVDVQGPFNPVTVGGARYAVEFAMCNSPAIYTAVIVAKSDAAHEVTPFAAHPHGLGFPV